MICHLFVYFFLLFSIIKIKFVRPLLGIGTTTFVLFHGNLSSGQSFMKISSVEVVEKDFTRVETKKQV